MKLLLVLALIPLSGCFGGVFGGIDTTDPKDLLKEGTWIIEVDYVSGYQPASSSISLLEQRLSQVSNRDVDVRVGNAIAATGRSWSVDDVEALKKEHKDVKDSGDTITTYMAVLDGRSEKDTANEKVLGFAYAHNTVAIFGATIDATCGLSSLCTNPNLIERSVMVHEMGHILGLVNNGIKMQTNHEDAEHKHHSNNRNSVMYWAIDGSGVIDLFGVGRTPPTTFDSNDCADLKAAGGKGC